jgi:cobalamin biosynthetic protein CobC
MHTIPHGGRLLQAGRRWPDAPLPWIDLSTGINPAAYPFTPPGPDAWRRLPEPETVQALEAAAAAAYGVADTAMVAAAPGAQALIQLLPFVLPQRRIAIVSPTYAEHAAAWRAAGADTVATPAPTGRAAVLCNPNNPDGARHDPATLAALAETMDLLVVDEAFADFEPGLSLAPFLPRRGVVVLRSFGKAYGLAGLRLGFALAEPAVAASIRRALGLWAIGGPALAIGAEALADAAWRNAAAATAHASASRLDSLLVGAGLRVVGGTALYRLVETPNAGALATRLARAGILVRRFEHAPHWLRFGLPGADSAWRRLAEALAAG